MKQRVLILCTGNSCRSQMAEGVLRRYGDDRYEVFSAGILPSRVNPVAIQVMKEIGIDISSHTSKSAEQFVGEPFDHIITVCDNAKVTCPAFPGNARRTHWSFDDPAELTGSEEMRLAEFRRVRDEIAERLDQFATTAAELK